MIGHDHVAGLGLLESALHSHDIDLQWLTVVPADRFDTPDVDVAFPAPEPWDLIITLGAPWPRERIRNWAGTEAAFLRCAHEGGVPILAICFGAQLLAETLGGTTRPLGRSRIGWHDIRPTTGSGIPAGPWFCWNSDQIVPPRDAVVLATSNEPLSRGDPRRGRRRPRVRRHRPRYDRQRTPVLPPAHHLGGHPS